MMNNHKFDERQLWIRGNIFMHAFIAQVALLLVNAFLVDNGFIWAERFHENLLLLLIPIFICSLELIFRDVYVQTKAQRLITIGIFSIGSIFGIITCMVDYRKGEAFITNDMLTSNGGSLATFLIFFTITVCLIIKTIKDRIASSDE
jgi:hypothetical protein